MSSFGKRCDSSFFLYELIPGMFACIEDIVIGMEDAMAEEVVFEVLPWFFGGIAFGCGGGDIDEGDVVGNAQGV